MDKKFDLTTKDGIVNAAKELGDKDLALLLIPGYGPMVYLGKKAIDAINGVLSTTESTIQEQTKAAVEIIKAGKQAGVDNMEVTLDQKAGLNFGSEIEGLPIKVMVGKSGKMTINVKYK